MRGPVEGGGGGRRRGGSGGCYMGSGLDSETRGPLWGARGVAMAANARRCRNRRIRHETAVRALQPLSLGRPRPARRRPASEGVRRRGKGDNGEKHGLGLRNPRRETLTQVKPQLAGPPAKGEGRKSQRASSSSRAVRACVRLPARVWVRHAFHPAPLRQSRLAIRGHRPK